MTSSYRKSTYGSAELVSKQVSDYVISKRNDYSYATLKVCLVKVQGLMRPIMAKLELFNATPQLDHHDPYIADYDDWVLLSYNLNIDQVLSILSSIQASHSFIISSDGVKIELTDRGECYLLNSRSRYGWGYHQWPCLYASIRIPEFQVSSNSQILAKRGLPLYPDSNVAVSEFLGLSQSIGHQSNMYQFFIVVPDFKARIDKVIISGRKVTIKVETNKIDQSKIIAKVHLSNATNSYQSGDLQLNNLSAFCETDFEPTSITACILDDKDDVLDLREHHLDWAQYNDDVIVESPNNQIVELIARGESDTVEFKTEPSNELLESFVSFANMNGGMIMLGVNNNGKIVGWDTNIDKFENDLISKIRGSIQPANIKFKLQQVPFESPSFDQSKKIVTVITIFGGENKPYYLRDKGILVRHGGTDRLITPSELDEIYAKRNVTNRASWV